MFLFNQIFYQIIFIFFSKVAFLRQIDIFILMLKLFGNKHVYLNCLGLRRIGRLDCMLFNNNKLMAFTG
mgnify:CR=1 FL=1